MVRQPAKTKSNACATRVGQKLPGPRRPTWLWIAGTSIIAIVLACWVIFRLIYPQPTADAIWKRAQANFHAGRYEEVALDLGRLDRMRRPTPLDWFLRGQLAAIREELAEASALLAKVPDDHEVAAHARLMVGQIERRRDRARLAEAAFLAALRLDPSLVRAHRELITIYGIQLRRAEFKAEFLALEKLAPLSFDDVYHWTSLLNNAWDPADVVETLTRYVAADPLDRHSRIALAEIFRRMGRHELSESTLAPLAGDDPLANVIRIKIALDLREIERADRLLALGRADDPVLARLRGAEALGCRKIQTAIEQFQIAYAANPDDHEAVFGLWAALELKGDKQKAQPLRAAARNLDRLNSLLQRGRTPSARQDLALIHEFGALCEALHRDDEACAWFHLAIAANPTDKQAQQALFRIQSASSLKKPAG